VQRVCFPEVNQATLRVLSAEGCDVRVPAGQGCCGALSRHAGRQDEAQAFARAFIERFEEVPAEFIVVNAAGCGSHLKEYGALFPDAASSRWRARAAALAAKVRDVSELLVALGPVAERKPIDARVAYHDACHLSHAQGIRRQPRALLQAIPGLQLCEIPDGDQCCGSAGIYNLVQPEAADEIGARKAINVMSTRPDLMATGNPGCTLQIRKILRARGQDLPAAHPIELLDASIRGVPWPGYLPRPVGIIPGKT
jgi:glycolate oxidase iron-sulfur subunit